MMRQPQAKGGQVCQMWGREGTRAAGSGQGGHGVGLRPLPAGRLSNGSLHQITRRASSNLDFGSLPPTVGSESAGLEGGVGAGPQNLCF